MPETKISSRSQFLLTRTVPIIGTILILYFVFLIYELEVYQWLCENESNHAACYMVGTLKDERGNTYEAKSFYERSCELDYGLGCFNLGKMAEKEGQKEDMTHYYEKACRLKYDPACKILQNMSEASKMEPKRP